MPRPPSGQNPVYGWPFVRILAADASGKIILPVSSVAIQAATASFVVTPLSPVVQLTNTQPQSVVLTTVGTPAFPSGQNFLYQYNSQAGPNGNGLPYANQLYVLQNVSLTNAATITSDFGTVNGSASFYGRGIESPKGSRFYLCERSASDPNFPRYPQLAALQCLGYVPLSQLGG
jgi:hypothetical protein